MSDYLNMPRAILVKDESWRASYHHFLENGNPDSQKDFLKSLVGKIEDYQSFFDKSGAPKSGSERRRHSALEEMQWAVEKSGKLNLQASDVLNYAQAIVFRNLSS